LYYKPGVGWEMSRTRLLSSPRSFLFSAGSCRPFSGVRFGFRPVSGSGSENNCLADANFFVDITDIHDRRIMLTFHNRAAVPCDISEIYFEDGGTFSVSVQSVRGAGEAMSRGRATGSSTGSQRVTAGWHHDFHSGQVASRNPEDAAALQDGIMPNESLGIVFDLQAGVTLADIVSALGKGRLNISLKLQGVAQNPGGILINDTRPGPGLV
jgi:hypothetical protein